MSLPDSLERTFAFVWKNYLKFTIFISKEAYSWFVLFSQNTHNFWKVIPCIGAFPFTAIIDRSLRSTAFPLSFFVPP